MVEIDRFKFAEDAQENIEWHLREAVRILCSSFSFFITLNNSIALFWGSNLLPLSSLLLRFFQGRTSCLRFGLSCLSPGDNTSGLASGHCEGGQSNLNFGGEVLSVPLNLQSVLCAVSQQVQWLRVLRVLSCQIGYDKITPVVLGPAKAEYFDHWSWRAWKIGPSEVCECYFMWLEPWADVNFSHCK